MSEGGSAARDARFDVLKGLAILAVVAHHVTGFGLGAKWHGADSQLALEFVNRFVRFAVPTFILVSVFLVGRGVAAVEVFQWKPYLVKRLKGTIYPYFVWTLIYLGLHAFAGRHSSPTAAMGFKSSNPAVVVKTLGWIFGFGKASFHLYFMVALLQVQLLLPFIVRGGRRFLGGHLWRWVTAGIVGQLLVYIVSHEIGVFYWSHGSEPPLPPFSSMFYGYLLPTVVGAGLAVRAGLQPQGESLEFPSETWALALPFLIFIPYSVNDVLARFPIAEEGLFMAYSTAMGVALLTLCAGFRGRLSTFLVAVGVDSLGIYLVHPIFLELIRSKSSTLGALPLPEVWLFLMTLGFTWIGLRFLRLCRLDRILFGR